MKGATEMTTESLEAVAEALDPITTMLRADGYTLDVDVVEQRLRLRIRPTAEACAECLVPSTVMEPMISQALSDAGVAAPIDLRYPDAHLET